MSRAKTSERKQRRRESASLRKAEWETLSVLEKLDSLKKRGHNHCAQATKLRARLTVKQRERMETDES